MELSRQHSGALVYPVGILAAAILSGLYIHTIRKAVTWVDNRTQSKSEQISSPTAGIPSASDIADEVAKKLASGKQQETSNLKNPLALTDAEQEIVNKLIERYQKRHKSPPTVAWINQRLKQQKQSFRVSDCPEQPATLIDVTGVKDVTIKNSEFDTNCAAKAIEGKGAGNITVQGTTFKQIDKPKR